MLYSIHDDFTTYEGRDAWISALISVGETGSTVAFGLLAKGATGPGTYIVTPLAGTEIRRYGNRLRNRWLEPVNKPILPIDGISGAAPKISHDVDDDIDGISGAF